MNNKIVFCIILLAIQGFSINALLEWKKPIQMKVTDMSCEEIERALILIKRKIQDNDRNTAFQGLGFRPQILESNENYTSKELVDRKAALEKEQKNRCQNINKK